MEKQEALLTFLRGQDARNGSSEYRPALKYIAREEFPQSQL